MKKIKYALLDTDFISKTHFIHGEENKSLSDLVVAMPEYCFFCHSQIIKELSRHNQQAIGWLQCRIEEQKIQCYTDEKIIDELMKIRGDFAFITYAQMLKEACDAFSKSYFETHYQSIGNFDFLKSTKQDFLDTLQAADEEVGKHNSLGEIKSYVLLQLLSLMQGEQIYVFCSDDKAARNGAISFDNVRCISALSAFLRLKKEILWTYEEAKPYIDSYIRFCEEHNQQIFKVMEASDVPRMQKVPCEQALEEIFADRFIELKNGLLKYKSEENY